jgi:hypothetical protein
LLDPPALIHAMWEMLFASMERDVPVALPPEVAQVYLDQPGAVAGHAWRDCGYLLPSVRGRLAYDGPCPCCAVVNGERW